MGLRNSAGESLFGVGRRRRLVLAGLTAAAIVGLWLVLTAPADGPPLTEVMTSEGLVTKIPEGWVASEQFGFRFLPPGSVHSDFESWTVARACGPDGCEPRPLEAWLAAADRLPTFVQAYAPDGGFDVQSDKLGERSRVLTAQTSTGAQVVFVAAFADGADFYAECGVVLPADGDRRLLDALVAVCMDTRAEP